MSGSRGAWVGALLGVSAAAVPLIALWGFTVDDALITARVAHHIALGHGHRFNLDGPIVDAVTPLGYAALLAPFAATGPLAALSAALVIGALAWLAAAAWLGRELAREGERRVRFAPLALLALSVPLAAWASSGMETGIVTALATFALVDRRAAPLIAGLCAGFRPELLPWALCYGAGGAIARDRSAKAAIVGLLLALSPALLIALARFHWFGSPTPLAAIAKPSDPTHGLAYAILAFTLTGIPALCVAPVWRLGARERAIALASAVHFLSLIASGGDWMVLHRLMVPVLPGMLLVAARVAERAALPANVARLVIASALSSVAWITQAGAAREVMTHRLQLITEARPLLDGVTRVAAVDVGWLGAATAAAIVDLAGVTDPTVARLAGGHTTKRVGPGFLRARGVDAVVLRLLDPEPARPWTESRFAYGVERGVAAQAAELGFVPAGTLALGGTSGGYLILRAESRASASTAPSSASRIARASR